ncbi:MAG: hypothetical protein WC509_00130 [Candidatus Izemoplasmatales bacterium]
MRAHVLWILTVFCSCLTGCLAVPTAMTTTVTTVTTAPPSTSAETTTIALTTILSTVSTTDRRYDYLGETPPTNRVIRFDPTGYVANATWFWHSAPTFSPDGNEMYWSKYLVSSDRIQIWFTRKVDGLWTAAAKLEVEGIEGDTNCPAFIPGDDGLYFMNFDGIAFGLYRATRNESGWGNAAMVDIPIPEGLSLGWSFAIAGNKNLYVPLSTIGGLGIPQIYVSVFHEGVYETPVPIENQGTGLYGNGDPAIAPDESFLIFMSSRAGGLGAHDLYISYRTEDSTFTEPVNLGSQVNTSQEDGRAHVSEDGIYLFYTSFMSGDRGYSPYWIRIDQLNVIRDR